MLNQPSLVSFFNVALQDADLGNLNDHTLSVAVDWEALARRSRHAAEQRCAQQPSLWRQSVPVLPMDGFNGISLGTRYGRTGTLTAVDCTVNFHFVPELRSTNFLEVQKLFNCKQACTTHATLRLLSFQRYKKLFKIRDVFKSIRKSGTPRPREHLLAVPDVRCSQCQSGTQVMLPWDVE